jgi:GATA-binding protein
MPGAAAQYEERGGLLRPLHAHANTNTNTTTITTTTGGAAQFNPATSSTTSITEHDYRFPRRPGEPAHQRNSTISRSGTKDSSAGASDKDKLDFSVDSNARKELLRESFFPSWKDDAAGEELDSPDEMQKKDPLATQIWRLYSKTKKQLPNQERMENLTWRMMAMNLRRRKQEEAARSVWSILPRALPSSVEHISNYQDRKSQQNTQHSVTVPSGIAQLRQTSDQNTPTEHSDAMNLDDFIFSENISTPLGIGMSPSPELSKKDVSLPEKSSNAVASAIPIKMRKESAQFAIPQSVPVPHNLRNNDEFNYVQRHIRKTSIDERRVSTFFLGSCFRLWSPSGPLSILHS